MVDKKMTQKINNKHNNHRSCIF